MKVTNKNACFSRIVLQASVAMTSEYTFDYNRHENI